MDDSQDRDHRSDKLEPEAMYERPRKKHQFPREKDRHGDFGKRKGKNFGASAGRRSNFQTRGNR